MSTKLDLTELLEIAFFKEMSGKYLCLEFILSEKGLIAIDPNKITEGIDAGEHYCKNFIKKLNEYSENALETIHNTKDDIYELIKEIKTNPLREKPKENKEKSKMNLSVSELALGVKFLEIVKIIDAQQKTELYRMIIENIQTKGSENIGYKSFKNKFENPDNNAVKFWQDKFAEIQKYIQENL